MSDFTKKIMDRIREKHKASEMSLEELGQKMGYNRQSARKSAWQFLNNTADPRLSMVEKFANALGCEISEFLQ